MQPNPSITGAPSCTEPDQDRGSVNLTMLFIGLLFVINGYLVTWLNRDNASVGDYSALIGSVLLGARIFRNAILNLAKGSLTTNELVAIAVLASFASGHYHEAGLVAFFMLLAEMIETRTAAGARASIESLIKLTPTRARRIINTGEEEVAAKDLLVGDIIRVRPGDVIPADGMIDKGAGSINQANITGESMPVDKKSGDEVFQGTQNITGVLEVRVTKAGEDTTFSRVRELILAAEKTKLPFMKIVDQYMGYYTPLILVIGALVWAVTNDLTRVITVFIVGCPCAFILATPTAIVAALSAAARLGVLIKNVGDIELAAKINAFIFDKTGTLTTGKLAVSRLANAEGIKPAELLLAAATAEKYSNHPTAKALQTLADEAGLKLADPQDFTEVTGRGVKARVNGEWVLVGRELWMREQNVTGDYSSKVDVKEAEGYSLVFVSVGGKFIGWIGLTDQVRTEAASALLELKDEGVRRMAIVSGDLRLVAERVGREIGCEEVIAECLPQNKVEFVRQMKAKGYTVAVVGDGVNDAPALAAGDIGIAMGAAGSEVAINSATIALMNNDLKRLPFLVRLSRVTRSVINQNFLLGILFVVGGLVLASLKLINPVLAACLHVVGSMIVVFNSARLVRQGEELEPFLKPLSPAPTTPTEGASALSPKTA